MSAARAAAAVATALLAGTAAAQPPADAALERRVQAAVAADPRLAPLRLTVSVVDRVAVVGGPVPDPAAKRAVEAAVNAVPGLAAVRLNCWVPLVPTPAVGPAKPPATPRPPAADLPPLALPLPHAPAPPRPVEPPPPPAPEAVTAGRQAERRGWLAPPVAGGGTIPPAGVPPVPPARFATLTAADARFRQFAVDVGPTGTAVIAGRGDPAAAWDLAAVLRRQPGITRVVVGRIEDR